MTNRNLRKLRSASELDLNLAQIRSGWMEVYSQAWFEPVYRLEVAPTNSNPQIRVGFSATSGIFALKLLKRVRLFPSCVEVEVYHTCDSIPYIFQQFLRAID